ncbi:MAG: type II secretion system protein [Candidatus Coprovivens sp.]
MNNKGFSKMETLFIIVIVAILAVCGITIVTLTTRDKKETTFKENANQIILDAKNAYAEFIRNKKEDYIVVSDDGVGKGMCITIDGLKQNGFTENPYTNYDGYVVIEEYNDTYYYSLWLTNKELVIDGIESKKINDASSKNQLITEYNEEMYSSRVRTSFTGTTMSKGGTGTDSQTKRYQTKCISEKID